MLNAQIRDQHIKAAGFSLIGTSPWIPSPQSPATSTMNRRRPLAFRQLRSTFNIAIVPLKLTRISRILVYIMTSGLLLPAFAMEPVKALAKFRSEPNNQSELQCPGQRLCSSYDTKRRTCDVSIGLFKHRMIEGIDELGP